MAEANLKFALDHGECAVCFDPLCTKGAAVLTKGEWLPTRSSVTYTRPIPKRICIHFLCTQCAPTIEPKNCPVCRRPFDLAVPVPHPLAKPMKWFHIVDHDQNGVLDRKELTDALKGMFPVEPECLEETIAAKWSHWDGDGNGTIDADEFRQNVAPFLAETLSSLKRRMDQDIPDLETEPAEWFKAFDQRKSGSLTQLEVVRALIQAAPGMEG